MYSKHLAESVAERTGIRTKYVKICTEGMKTPNYLPWAPRASASRISSSLESSSGCRGWGGADYPPPAKGPPKKRKAAGEGEASSSSATGRSARAKKASKK